LKYVGLAKSFSESSFFCPLVVSISPMVRRLRTITAATCSDNHRNPRSLLQLASHLQGLSSLLTSSQLKRFVRNYTSSTFTIGEGSLLCIMEWLSDSVRPTLKSVTMYSKGIK
jgi:hypothetical protein